MSRQLDVNYVSLIDLMCGRKGCRLYDEGGSPIQWDNGHLTPLGSVEIMELAAARGDLPPVE